MLHFALSAHEARRRGHYSVMDLGRVPNGSEEEPLPKMINGDQLTQSRFKRATEIRHRSYWVTEIRLVLIFSLCFTN